MKLRQATPADLAQIVELANATFCRVHNKLETMGEQFPLLFHPDNANHLWIAVEDGTVVSHFGTYVEPIRVAGVQLQLASVGSVATDPKYRNRGISSRLLQMAFQQLKEEGCDVVFVSGNRGLYLRNGCYEVGKMNRLVWKRPEEDAPSVTGSGCSSEQLPILERGLTVRLASEAGRLPTEAAEQMAAIEHQEETRYISSAAKLQTLFDAAGYARIFPWRQEAYFVEKSFHPVAYFILGIGSDSTVRLLEFHGDRTSAAEGLLARIRRSDYREVVAPLLGHEHELFHLLSSNGFEQTKELPFPGTVKFLNPSQTWEKFINFDASFAKRYAELAEMRPEDNEAEFARVWFEHIPLPWPNGLHYI